MFHVLVTDCIDYLCTTVRLFFRFASVLNKTLPPPVRRSGASSSCSSYYSTSAAKAQLLSQMKDFTDNRERDDDELTYKVTHTDTVLVPNW